MSVQDDIKSTVEGHKIVLYMKGSPMMPQCGFSATVVQIFRELGAPIHTVNVLADATVREGIKAFTQWPTIPQIFIDGKFIGGCDIVKDLHASGELKKLVEAAGVPSKA